MVSSIPSCSLLHLPLSESTWRVPACFSMRLQSFPYFLFSLALSLCAADLLLQRDAERRVLYSNVELCTRPHSYCMKDSCKTLRQTLTLGITKYMTGNFISIEFERIFLKLYFTGKFYLFSRSCNFFCSARSQEELLCQYYVRSIKRWPLHN